MRPFLDVTSEEIMWGFLCFKTYALLLSSRRQQRDPARKVSNEIAELLHAVNLHTRPFLVGLT